MASQLPFPLVASFSGPDLKLDALMCKLTSLQILISKCNQGDEVIVRSCYRGDDVSGEAT